MPNRPILSYHSSSGQTVDLTNWPFYWNETSIRDYAWEYESVKKPIGYGSRFTRITRGVTEKPIILLVYDKGNDIYDLVDELMGVFESDVARETPGRLYFNDYYTTGYITSVSVGDRIRNIYTKLELTFTTEYPMWVLEEKITLPAYAGSTGEGFKFPFNFPFGFVASMGAVQLINDHYALTNAIIRFYGPAENPQLAIGTHIYTVNGALGASERFEIDQLNRTVQKITQSGEKINSFAQRGKEYSVFEPIHPGASVAFYNGAYDIEVILLPERSVPKWS